MGGIQDIPKFRDGLHSTEHQQFSDLPTTLEHSHVVHSGVCIMPLPSRYCLGPHLGSSVASSNSRVVVAAVAVV